MKNIKYNFAKYVSLNIVGMIGISCYILADTFFIAKAFGALGLTALNFSIPIYSIVHAFGLMIGIGSATEFSILSHSKKSKSESYAIFTHALIFAAILSSIFIVVALFCVDRLCLLLGTDSETYSFTYIYINTILFFSPAFLLNNIMLAFVRNDNNPKLSMIAMLVGSFVNIILDYLFIFIFEMGMFGAALATGIAPIISLSILSIHIICKKNTFYILKCKLKIFYFKRIVSLGFSSFIIEISSAISLIVFNLIILGIEGNIGVAAYGVVANIALIETAIFIGLSHGAQPLASMYYGRRDSHSLSLILRYSIITSFLFAFVSYFTLFIFTENIVFIFNSDGDKYLEVLATGGMKLYFIGYFFAGINIIVASFLSAVSKPTYAMIISTLRSFFLLVPLALIFSFLFKMTGVWFSFITTEFIVFLFSLFLLKRKLH